MTTILCAVAIALCPGDRGGHATYARDHGGQAVPVVLVRELPRFPSWVCIHGHEADWQDADDPYWGGLQMDRGFMLAYGRDAMARHHGGWADTWTPAEQIVVAERAYRSGRGFGPWPNTAHYCGFSTGRVAPQLEPVPLP